jgi:hypothetical protein
MPRPPLPRLIRALALGTTLSAAAGAAWGAGPGEEDPLDFALHLARLKTDLRASGRNDTATVKQIGIVSFDRRTAALQPGLLLGYAWIDVEHGPAATLAPEGFYIGAAVRSELLNNDHFLLTATASYLYQRVRDSNATLSVTLEWYQPQADLDARWRLTSSLGLRLGATYGRADADEKSSGTVAQTVSLARDAVLGGRAGLELDLGGDGQMGFMLHQAIGDGVEVYFQRQF